MSERTADTARARLIWILAKDRTEAKTRHMTARDVAVMAVDRLSDAALPFINENFSAWINTGGPVKFRNRP